ncbi:MAG: type II secretion system protein GspL [Oleibacter sp.]|nr:type II secretion system protein GspL [Thalassolituus sp.]
MISSNVVRWHGDREEWTIQYIQDGTEATVLLATWAAQQPEMSSVKLILSATNYVTHWVSLPGVKGRNVARALPFALEDSMIGDIANFTVIPGGSANGNHRAYVVATELLDNLAELLELHHLRMVSLTPETNILGEGCVLVQDQHDWLISIPGYMEGRLPQGALPPTLDYLSSKVSAQVLHIWPENIDQGNLLQTTVSSGHGDTFTEIELHTGKPEHSVATVNLLKGRVSDVSERSSAPTWWGGMVVTSVAASVVLVVFLLLSNMQLQSNIQKVSNNSLSLYKQWFPGERTTNYEALFKRKLRGDAVVGSAAFSDMMLGVSSAWGVAGSNNISIQGVRFSDRTGELLLEVLTPNQANLQAFKEAIEAKGLTAEIASASAEGNSIKGRLKVGGAA